MWLILTAMACLIVAFLSRRDRRESKATLAALIGQLPPEERDDVRRAFGLGDIEMTPDCEGFLDHCVVPFQRGHWWRRRVVLHCVRCDRDVEQYRSRREAVDAISWMTNERMRRHGLI